MGTGNKREREPMGNGAMMKDGDIKAAIKNAPTSGKAQIVLKDAGPRGGGRLAIVIRPLATRVAAEWYAIYYRAGQRKFGKLGTYPDMTLAEARERFRVEYAPTIQIGADPSNAYARRNNRKGGGDGTVRELFEAYAADLDRRGKASYQARRILLLRRDNAARVLGADRPAKDIKTADIVAHLAAIHARGTKGMADVVRAQVRAAFEFGLKSANDYTRKVDGQGWGLKYNPAAAIPADESSRAAGERHLTVDELRTFWRWCEENENRTNLCCALMLQAATGQRVTEVLAITADSYDRAEGIVDWSKTKNGMPHAIPLPPQAIEVLARMKPNRFGLYFPHRFKPDVHAIYTGPNKIVEMYLEESGAKPFTPRDLRRTWKTLAGQAGIGKDIRDRMQNHSISDVSSKHYDRWSYMPEKREAMARWGEFLARVLEGRPLLQTVAA